MEQKSFGRYSEEMTILQRQHREIVDEIEQCEKQVYEMESRYLEETEHGNIVKGWDGFLDSRPRKDHSFKRTKTTDADRIFSNSSYSWALQNVQPDEKDAYG
jgi:hypothetical protein